MNSEEKIELIGSIALIVLGLAGIAVSFHFAEKIEKQAKSDRQASELLRVQTWNSITDKPFYKNATLAEKNQIHAAYWNPTTD